MNKNSDVWLTILCLLVATLVTAHLIERLRGDITQAMIDLQTI